MELQQLENILLLINYEIQLVGLTNDFANYSNFVKLNEKQNSISIADSCDFDIAKIDRTLINRLQI